MEDTLRAFSSKAIQGEIESLNPCFNGRYSQSDREDFLAYLERS